jgi:uncharacterized protein
MKLNLMKLFDRELKELAFDTAIDIDGEDYKRFSVKSIDQCDITGKVYLINDELFIDVNYTLDVVFQCVRCLTDVNRKVKSSFSKQVVDSQDYHEEDESLLLLEGKEINLKEIIKEDMYLNLPEHVLCKDDCEGLCPICGTNLNEDTCDCEKDDIDPRLEKLKSLLD